MFAHRGLRKLHVIDHVSHSMLARGQVFQQGQPGWFRQSVEERCVGAAVLEPQGPLEWVFIVI